MLSLYLGSHSYHYDMVVGDRSSMQQVPTRVAGTYSQLVKIGLQVTILISYMYRED